MAWRYFHPAPPHPALLLSSHPGSKEPVRYGQHLVTVYSRPYQKSHGELSLAAPCSPLVVLAGLVSFIEIASSFHQIQLSSSDGAYTPTCVCIYVFTYISTHLLFF